MLLYEIVPQGGTVPRADYQVGLALHDRVDDVIEKPARFLRQGIDSVLFPEFLRYFTRNSTNSVMSETIVILPFCVDHRRRLKGTTTYDIVFMSHRFRALPAAGSGSYFCEGEAASFIFRWSKEDQPLAVWLRLG